MKAIDELRRLPNFGTVLIDGEETGLAETMVCVTRAQLNSISDAIERELEEEYVPLPKDADGEPIHVGDELYANIDGELWGEKVSYLCLQDDGWRIGNIGLVGDAMTHRKPPTVEDVLREFALKCEDAGYAGPDVEAIASEFAERLQLRKEDE